MPSQPRRSHQGDFHRNLSGKIMLIQLAVPGWSLIFKPQNKFTCTISTDQQQQSRTLWTPNIKSTLIAFQTVVGGLHSTGPRFDPGSVLYYVFWSGRETRQCLIPQMRVKSMSDTCLWQCTWKTPGCAIENRRWVWDVSLDALANIIIIIIMKKFNRHSSHCHHGLKRREHNRYAPSHQHEHIAYSGRAGRHVLLLSLLCGTKPR